MINRPARSAAFILSLASVPAGAASFSADGVFASSEATRTTTSTVVYDVEAAAAISVPHVPAYRAARTDAGFAEDARGYVIDASPLAIPEPGPLIVLAAGFAGLGWARLRRR